MNKQIQELAEQARKYARDYVSECTLYGYYMEHNEYELRFEEKFAELIVRECAAHLKNCADAYNGSDADADYMEAMLHSADIIKEHFGVE